MSTPAHIDSETISQTNGARSSQGDRYSPATTYCIIAHSTIRTAIDTESELEEAPLETEEFEPLAARIAPPSLDHTLFHLTLHQTARMAVRTQPAMSPGLLARVTEAMTQSPLSFCKRYESSYETPSPLSSPTLPIRKRYRGTSKLVEDTEDESSDSDTKGEGSEDEGPGLEEEEATPEGQQKAVLVVNTAADEPLGLGYGSLRRRELALGEGSMPSTFEIGQSSRSVSEQQRVEEILHLVCVPVQTPPSPEWTFGLLPVSPSSSAVPTPVASPATTSATTIAVDEGEFLEVGAQLELHGSILQDHTQRLDALPLEFFKCYRLRSLKKEQERATVTFDAIWRPVLALESWTGHVDAQRAEMWQARYDDHMLIHDLLVQNTTMHFGAREES
ncbi:hypothetical protein Tco_0956414 [Tanacetum coccineum]